MDQGRGDKTAILWESDEPGEGTSYTYSELTAEVKKFANVLKNLGVSKGDPVAIYMPMIPQLPIAMLACARIGAIHSVVFGGFSALVLVLEVPLWVAGKTKISAVQSWLEDNTTRAGIFDPEDKELMTNVRGLAIRDGLLYVAFDAGGLRVVDISNPLDFSKGMPPRLSVCNDDSLGEQIQRAFPNLKVVKTLNTVKMNGRHLQVYYDRLPGGRVAAQVAVGLEVEVGPGGDALQFLRPERELEEEVHRRARVMRQFLRFLPVFLERRARQPDAFVELDALLDPILVPDLPAPRRLRLKRVLKCRRPR